MRTRSATAAGGGIGEEAHTETGGRDAALASQPRQPRYAPNMFVFCATRMRFLTLAVGCADACFCGFLVHNQLIVVDTRRSSITSTLKLAENAVEAWWLMLTRVLYCRPLATLQIDY